MKQSNSLPGVKAGKWVIGGFWHWNSSSPSEWTEKKITLLAWKILSKHWKTARCPLFNFHLPWTLQAEVFPHNTTHSFRISSAFWFSPSDYTQTGRTEQQDGSIHGWKLVYEALPLNPAEWDPRWEWSWNPLDVSSICLCHLPFSHKW